MTLVRHPKKGRGVLGGKEETVTKKKQKNVLSLATVERRSKDFI